MPTATEIYTIEMRVNGDAAVKELQRATNRLNTTAKATQRTMQTMNKRMDTMAGGARRLAGVLATVFSAQTVKRALDFGDNLAKSADRVGLTVEAFQELQFAFGQSGVEAGAFNKALQLMNRAMGEALRGVGEGRDVFKALGVDLKNADGSLKNTNTFLLEIADSMAGLSRAQQLDFANKIFGRSGTSFVNLLDEGAAGINRLTKQAQELGLVLGADVAKEAERLNDQFEILGLQTKTVLVTAFVSLAGTVERIALNFRQFGSDLINMRGSATALATAITALLIPSIVSLTRAMVAFTLSNPFTALARAAILAVAVIISEWGTLEAFFKYKVPGWIDYAIGAIFTALSKLADVTSQYLDPLIAKMNAVSNAFGGNQISTAAEDAVEFGRLANEAFTSASENAALYEAEVNKLRDTIEGGADANERFARTTLEIADAADTATKKLQYFDKHVDDWLKAQQRMQEEARRSAEQIGGAFGDIFGTLASDMISGTKSAKKAFKSFVDDMIALIAKLIAKYLALQAVTALFGGGAGGVGLFSTGLNATAASVGASARAMTASANQQNMVVGRQVTSTTSDGDAATGGDVIVNNYSGQQVDVDTSGSDTVITIGEVRKAIASDLQRGGNAVARAMEGAYNVNRSRSAF